MPSRTAGLTTLAFKPEKGPHGDVWGLLLVDLPKQLELRNTSFIFISYISASFNIIPHHSTNYSTFIQSSVDLECSIFNQSPLSFTCHVPPHTPGLADAPWPPWPPWLHRARPQSMRTRSTVRRCHQAPCHGAACDRRLITQWYRFLDSQIASKWNLLKYNIYIYTYYILISFEYVWDFLVSGININHSAVETQMSRSMEWFRCEMALVIKPLAAGLSGRGQSSTRWWNHHKCNMQC